MKILKWVSDLRGGEHPAPDTPPGPDLAGAGIWPFEILAVERTWRQAMGEPDTQKVE